LLRLEFFAKYKTAGSVNCPISNLFPCMITTDITSSFYNFLCPNQQPCLLMPTQRAGELASRYRCSWTLATPAPVRRCAGPGDAATLTGWVRPAVSLPRRFPASGSGLSDGGVVYYVVLIAWAT